MAEVTVDTIRSKWQWTTCWHLVLYFIRLRNQCNTLISPLDQNIKKIIPNNQKEVVVWGKIKPLLIRMIFQFKFEFTI